MFIRRIRLNAFGRLAGSCTFVPGKPNIICQENESGKSTLVDAILYSLYGFPPSRSKPGELKPREKYRPWFSPNGGEPSFQAELELSEVEEREYTLRCDFSRQQPFQLVDSRTGKPIELEGLSIGRRFFGMPLESFLECFFFRQSERDNAARDNIVHVVEEAASSSRRAHEASVRQALEALSECRIHLPEFSAAPVKAENLLKTLDGRCSAASGRLEALKAECDRKAVDMVAAQDLDEEIQQLHERQLRYEYECFSAELHESETLLSQQEGLAAAARERQERLLQLKPYQKFDPTLRPRVQELYGVWMSAKAKCEQIHRQMDGSAPVDASSAAVSMPPALRDLSRSQVDHLRQTVAAFAEQKQQIRSLDARCGTMHADLSMEGVKLDTCVRAKSKLEQLTPGDRRILFDFAHESAETEKAMSAAQARVAETIARTSQSKAAREKLSAVSGLWFMGGFLSVVLGILFILLGVTWAMVLSFVLAVPCAALGFVFMQKSQVYGASAFAAAVAQEISASDEVKKLRERLETLRFDFDQALFRNSFRADEIPALQQTHEWSRLAGPYIAEMDVLERLRAEHAATCDELCAFARHFDPGITSEGLEVSLLRKCISLVEEHAGEDLVRSRLQLDNERLSRELEAAEARLDVITRELDALTAEARAECQPLEAQILTFLHGCDEAVKLSALSNGQPHADGVLIGPRQLGELRARVGQLQRKLEDMRAENPELSTAEPSSPAPVLRERAEQLRARCQDLRLRRIHEFSECDRASETLRHEGPALEAEVERLEDLRAEIAEFHEALRIASQELSEISGQVFTQWANALNSRVNRILSQVNPVYGEVEFNDDLEFSLFSHELGKRLDARQLQHLSTGARDQLNLAVRIAISEYLSAHVGRIPLVLDEPFAHWDDQRFVRGLQLLTKLAEERQVIILSCHRWRYHQLRQAHPDIAEILHFCALGCNVKLET